MKSPVEKEKTSLEGKLILLVLIGILGCLIVIVAQNFGRNSATEAVAAVEPEQPAPTEPVETSPSPETVAPATPVAKPSQREAPIVAVRQSESYVSLESRTLRAPVRVVNPAPPPLPVANLGGPPPNDVPIVTRTRTAQGATLSGRVVLAGKPPPEVKINLGANASTCGAVNPDGLMTRHYVVSTNGGLANVLVYIKAGLQGQRFQPPQYPTTIYASGCSYEPYVSWAQVGQKVIFRNLDPFMHNFHCTAKNNHEFNLAMPVQNMVVERTFDRPEVFIRFKCDVNEWMFAYLAVLPHPFAAVSDLEGNYKFPAGLPPGNYTLAAQHLKAGEMTQQTSVGSTEVKAPDFTFQVPNH